MDVDRFDRLTRTLATTGTRRGLLHLLVALPLAGGLVTRLTEGGRGDGNVAIVGGGGGKRRHRKAGHNRGKHKDRDNHKPKRKGKHKRNGKGKNPSTTPSNPTSPSDPCARTNCNGCCAGGSCGPCLVFATSTLQNGNLGGLNGADATCQARARTGGLPGTYRAWLSDDTGSPSTRFGCTAAACSGQGYRLPDAAQTLIATDWSDLTDGTLIHAINVTELGGAVPLGDPDPDPQAPFRARAWSNTAVDGTVRMDVPNDDLACVKWTYDGGGTPRPGVFGGTGNANATDPTWTVEGASPCGVPRRLYCFQQA